MCVSSRMLITCFFSIRVNSLIKSCASKSKPHDNKTEVINLDLTRITCYVQEPAKKRYASVGNNVGVVNLANVM